MSNQQHVQELSSEKTEFKREIGVFGGVSIIGGIMIGSGIFYLGSYVLERTNYNYGLALLAWILGGIISLFGGLCYAELGAAMPKAGGRIVYLTEAFHPCVGFLAGFVDWLIAGPGSIAALAIALPTALKSFVGLSGTGIKVFAIVLIVGLTIYNCYGVKLASILQNVSMVAKLVPILLILGGALVCGKLSPDLGIGAEVAKAGGTGTVSMVAFAIVASLWAYEGWTNLNTVTEEIKNPKRDLPLALIIGIGGITVLYTLFNYAIYRVLPYDTVVSMIKAENYYLGTEVAKLIFGNVGAMLVTAAMVIAIFGSINGLVLAQPRMYYAMAEEGHFFKSFAKLHPKYKVPTTALIVQAVISIVLVLMRDLDQLTNLVVFQTMMFNCLTVVAVPILRKKMPEIDRPYKVWFYPVSIIFMVLVYIGLVISTFFDDPVSAVTGFVVPVIGVFVYMYFDKQLKKEGKSA